MQYHYVSEDQKKNALVNRLTQLEQEHFENTLYRDEAEVIGSTAEVDRFSAVLQGLELRINDYRKKLNEYDSSAE